MGINTKILAALVAVRTEVIAGNYPVTGICNAVVDQVYGLDLDSEIDILLSRAIRKWPGFSGDRVYPVPHPDISPIAAYGQYACDVRRSWWMWESPEYGMKRRELLDFLIANVTGLAPAQEITK